MQPPDLDSLLDVGGSEQKRTAFTTLIELAMNRLTAVVGDEVVAPPGGIAGYGQTNSRHAGAVGARFGSWFEYGLSFQINQILLSEDIPARAYPVISHEFCDLEIRRLSDGALTIRLEVKTVDPSREESVFNISEATARTYLNRDFIIVMAWRFRRESSANGTPVVIESYILLDAWSYCTLRDQSWFGASDRENQSSDSPKGWDLLGPVVYSASDSHSLKGEEGNIGKGWRVAKNSVDLEIPDSWDYIDSTQTALSGFHRDILDLGFVIESEKVSEHYQCQDLALSFLTIGSDQIRIITCSRNGNANTVVVSDEGFSSSLRNRCTREISRLVVGIDRIVFIKI